MTPCQITAFITAVANIIAKDNSASQLALLGAIFTQLGDTLNTLSILNAEK